MPQPRPTNVPLLLPMLLAAAAVASLALDVPVGMRARRWNDPAVWEKDASLKSVHDNMGWFDTFEPFGHGRGIVLVLLALHQLDPKRRWAIPRLAACALAAGAIANLLKLTLARTRPNDLPFDFTGPVWATFRGWLPTFGIQSGLQSFPSAHTAAAAAFAAGLVWLYPQGRWLFSALAVLVGFQRIVSGAHFPSDVFAGAAAGCLAAMLLLYVGRLPVWFDRWESRWRGVK
jgi:membrane-associated phospholipid phosphatase